MAKVTEVVIDSLHPAQLARFWGAVLDGYAVRHYSSAEIAKLRERGLSPETDPAVALDGPGPTWFFQQTQIAKTNRNRIHFDISGTARTEETVRLKRLGASVREIHDSYTVMQDPEGNEFCIQDTG